MIGIIPIRGRRTSCIPCGGRRRRPRGMVMVVVMVVVAMISLAAFSFTEMMYLENKAARLRGDEAAAEQAGASGEELLLQLLALPETRRREMGGILDNPALLRAVPLFRDPRAEPRVRFSVLSPRIENGELVGARYGLEDESARLNLSVLAEFEKLQAGSGRQTLLKLPGMTEEAADAILDWIDADHQPRLLGAERDYYSSLERPYLPRNGPPESLEELLLVKGVDKLRLFGPDANRNYQIEPEEQAAWENYSAAGKGAAPPTEGRASSGGGGSTFPSWAAYLTLYSAERNVAADGRPRIDLNDLDLARLHRQLTERFEPRFADFIIAYRQLGPYGGTKLESASDFQVDVSKPAKFRLGSVLDVVGARVRVGTGKSATQLESPLKGEREGQGADLARWVDGVTTVKAEVIRGRINVNEAPREILLAIPGIDAALAERILAQRRQTAAPDDLSRRTAIWLLTEGLVDLPLMKVLLLIFNGGGDVFRTQIVGFFEGGGGPATRVEVVLDATDGRPRRVYWRNLRSLGRGFPPEWLGAQ